MLTSRELLREHVTLDVRQDSRASAKTALAARWAWIYCQRDVYREG